MIGSSTLDLGSAGPAQYCVALARMATPSRAMIEYVAIYHCFLSVVLSELVCFSGLIVYVVSSYCGKGRT